jgi:hypothetical protein
VRWNRVTEAFTVIQHDAIDIHQTPNAIRNSLCGFTDDGTPGTMADQDDVGQIVVDDEIDN